jgi:methionyl-tRNA formyltransferase
VTPGAGSPGELLHADAAGLVVACGSGALRLSQIQPEGGRKQPAEAFLAGHRLGPGDRFFSLEKAGH